MFMADIPIMTSKDDLLGTERLAEILANSILKWNNEESIIIGLYGKWGIGKTSIINMLKEKIEKANLDEDRKVLILNFNPWNFSEQKQLIKIFFEEISKQLQIKDKSKSLYKIADKLKLYGKFLTVSINLIDVFRYLFPFLFLSVGILIFTFKSPLIVSIIFLILSIFFFFLKKLTLSLSEFIFELARYNKKDLSQLKKELNDEIKKNNQKFLIIIDDIDRLYKEEIRQIFKLIRLNADFSNTIYLVSFDREIIEKSLEEDSIPGKEYLEKIIQVNFDVPMLQETRLFHILFEGLENYLKNIPQKYFDKTRWGNLFYSGFKNFFTSIRDIKRYLNSLKFNILLLVKENSIEVNPVDFMIIEGIRIFAPKIYNFIKENKLLFTSTSIDFSKGDLLQSKTKNRKEEIIDQLKKVDVANYSKIRDMLKYLFPQIEGGYGNEWQVEWSKELRICATNMFDRYFLLDVAENDISQFEIDLLFSNTSNYEKFFQKINYYLSIGKIKRLLERVLDFLDNFLLSDAENIILAFFNITDNLPTERGLFDIGNDWLVIKIIYNLLKRISDKNKRAEILFSCISKSNNLYGPLQFISIEENEMENKSMTYENLLNKKDIEKLKKLCLKKIREKAKTNILIDNPKLVYILYRWREWAEPFEVQNYINKLIKNDKKLIKFISKFIEQKQSLSLGDYVPNIEEAIQIKPLEDFVDLNYITKRLRDININKLSEDDKNTVKIFLNKTSKN